MWQRWLRACSERGIGIAYDNVGYAVFYRVMIFENKEQCTDKCILL